MKRAVFILLIIGLFVCSQALTLLATRAATGQPVKAESIGFFYKMDAHARYLDLKTKWQSGHRGELSIEQASELATEAYEKSSVESPFEKWLFHGGPSPYLFKGKLHIYNTTSAALLQVPLAVTIRAKVGELRVDPTIQMTDFEHLNATARWETVSQENLSVDALAPGEDMLVDVMRFHLLKFLKEHPNQWPTRLEVVVTSPQLGTHRQQLELVPDHFVVPVLY